MATEKLGNFLREVSNWSWEEFVRAERDESYTSNEAIIFSLVRSCAMQRMDAIRVSLNRLDGKLKTPIIVEYPKIYFLYPNAALEAPDPQPLLEGKAEEPEVFTGEILVIEEPEPEEESDLPSMSLRQTLTKMSGYPRQLPKAVVRAALETEIWMSGQGEEPREIPRVKSVVAAHLLTMAQNRDIGAISEVLDQIDGKLAETLQILGSDLYITNYSAIAPPGALPNADGILQMEARAAQEMWEQKLRKD